MMVFDPVSIFRRGKTITSTYPREIYNIDGAAAALIIGGAI